MSKYLTRGRADDEAYACHRLDRGVSGLLVVGKSRKIASLMRDQFERHEPTRQYVAIVAGDVEERQGTFRSYLATGENLDRFSTHDEEKGQLAITHYKVDRQLRGAHASPVPACAARFGMDGFETNVRGQHAMTATSECIGDAQAGAARRARHQESIRCHGQMSRC